MLTIIYLMFLHIVYVFGISPNNNYLGYTYLENSLLDITLAWLLASLPVFWMPITYKRPSQVIYWLLYLIAVVPATIMPVYLGRFDVGLKQGLLIVSSFFLLSFVFRIPLLSIPRFNVPSYVFWLIVAFISVMSSVYTLKMFGFKNSLPWILSPEVYNIRLQARSVMSSIGRLGSYIIIWQTQVFGPFFFVSGLCMRNWLLISSGVLLQVLVYSVLATKSSLFSLLLSYVIFLSLSRYSPTSFGLRFLTGAIGTVFLVILIDRFFFLNEWVLSSSLLRRLIFTPGLVTTYFFDFFSKNPPALLGHSILQKFVEYHYDVPPTFLIGLYYFNNPLTNADANLWADGYANFGVVGVFMFTFVLGIVLWFFDSISKPLSKEFAGALAAVPGYIFADSPLLTSLLTHGVLILLLLLWLTPPRLFGLARIKSKNL